MNTSVANWTDETMDLSEQLQRDCHDIVQTIMKTSDVEYKDATIVFVFNKLAELQVQINQLSQKINPPQ